MSNSVENSGNRKFKRSHYRCLGLVGQGQFGRVYCASHRQTGHIVALKELDHLRFPTHQFLRELRFLVSLAHPNIVKLYGLEQSPTGRHLMMDYCEGGTLRSLIGEESRLHPAQSLKLVADVLAGLAHAHGRNIIHCDIKPENILLTLTPAGWAAKISDFGIARLSQELSTQELEPTGSPAYMAPERFSGEYSSASDIYAVGILLFELLAGHRPFAGTPSALMVAHRHQPLCIPDSIAAELRPLLQRSLQKLPERRFRSATAMLEAVQTATLSQPGTSDWTPGKWLRPVTAAVPSPFRAVYTAALTQPIQQLFTARQSPSRSHPHLAPDREQLYQVAGDQIQRWDYGIPGLWTALRSDSDPNFKLPQPWLGQEAALSVTQVQLPAPIQAVGLCGQDCVAIAQRTLYHLKAEAFGPLPGHLRPPGESPAGVGDPWAIAQFAQDMLITTEPQGWWVAAAAAHAPAAPLLVGRCQTATPTLQPTPGAVEYALQLITLDARHLAAFCQGTAAMPGKSRLQVLNRRGIGLVSEMLPVSLQTIIPTPTPYRLLATESGSATSVLRLDLKPFRMLRIGVEIVPKLLAAMEWGYILVADDGGIVLVNHQGQMMGSIAGPPSPTAIAPMAAHGLAIATWHQGRGNLHIVDLRDLDLDIVF